MKMVINYYTQHNHIILIKNIINMSQKYNSFRDIDVVVRRIFRATQRLKNRWYSLFLVTMHGCSNL